MKEPIRLREAREELVALTYEQACAINALGRQLASKSKWWGSDEEARPERTLIICNPASDGQWKITIDNAIGAFGVDDLTFIVRPKICPSHALYLLTLGAGIPRFEQPVISLDTGDDLWELIALWFVRCTQAVLSHDLIRDYQEKYDQLNAARGQIDALGSAQLYYKGSLDLLCRYDEFSVDNPFNRVLLGALNALQTLMYLRRNTRRACRRLAAYFDDVGPLDSTDLATQTDRRSAYYEHALGLARLILAATTVGLLAGSKRAWSFLIRTPEAIEAGIRAVLKTGLAPEVCVSKYSTALIPSNVRIEPDLRFDPPGFVGDVKYKLYDSEWLRGDLYQSVAFAAGTGAKRACIVAFGEPDATPPPTVAFKGIEVTSLLWRFDDEIAGKDSALQLVDSCRKWLSAAPLRDVIL